MGVVRPTHRSLRSAHLTSPAFRAIRKHRVDRAPGPLFPGRNGSNLPGSSSNSASIVTETFLKISKSPAHARGHHPARSLTSTRATFATTPHRVAPQKRIPIGQRCVPPRAITAGTPSLRGPRTCWFSVPRHIQPRGSERKPSPKTGQQTALSATLAGFAPRPARQTHPTHARRAA
jgi:hypothetical protein